VLDGVVLERVVESGDAQASNLVLRGVTKDFEIEGKPLRVLEDFNLSVKPGEFISIVGASGCGKSTLLRLLAGLDTEYQGELLLDGAPIVGPSLDRGIVFQDHRLFPWLTVEDNIAMAFEARKIAKEEKQRLVREQIALVGLVGFEKAYPYQLSGGMAQRTAIARALVNQPEILLLDEPLAALDAFTRLHIQKELQRIWSQKGITMILVTHDIEEAVFLGDRVVVLQPRPGRIRRVVDIDLPHPRDRESAGFVRLRRDILREFE
jgi:ABC-type nitrate/sulfonate/bicarbonate transport system ATPase subunit